LCVDVKTVLDQFLHAVKVAFDPTPCTSDCIDLLRQFRQVHLWPCSCAFTAAEVIAYFFALSIYENGACTSDCIDLRRLLLDAGAKINAADAQGYTPLMWAAMQDDLGILQELLARGADVKAKDKKGFTVLEMAGGKKVRQVLMQAHDR